jgi:hypothetical protein
MAMRGLSRTVQDRLSASPARSYSGLQRLQQDLQRSAHVAGQRVTLRRVVEGHDRDGVGHVDQQFVGAGLVPRG